MTPRRKTGTEALLERVEKRLAQARRTRPGSSEARRLEIQARKLRAALERRESKTNEGREALER